MSPRTSGQRRRRAGGLASETSSDGSSEPCSGPRSALGSEPSIRGAGASGVVGTECPVPELFAETYARLLLPRIFRGEALGPAMLGVRRELLRRRKNPLGLIYTLYAANEVSLEQPVGH